YVSPITAEGSPHAWSAWAPGPPKERSMSRSRSVVGLAALLLGASVLSACSSGSSADGGGKTVYMLLPNTTTVRFVTQDGPDFVAAMKKDMPDAKVIIQ